MSVGNNRLVELALRRQRPAEVVMRIGKSRIRGDHRAIRRHGLDQLPLLLQRNAQAVSGFVELGLRAQGLAKL
jgi:hypothetical protein